MAQAKADMAMLRPKQKTTIGQGKRDRRNKPGTLNVVIWARTLGWVQRYLNPTVKLMVNTESKELLQPNFQDITTSSYHITRHLSETSSP